MGIAMGNSMEHGWTCRTKVDKSVWTMVIFHLLNYQRITLENSFWMWVKSQFRHQQIGGFAVDLGGNWIDLKLLSRTNFYWFPLVSIHHTDPTKYCGVICRHCNFPLQTDQNRSKFSPWATRSTVVTQTASLSVQMFTTNDYPLVN